MTLLIKTDQVVAVIQSLHAIHQLAEAAEKTVASSGLGPGYSQVSGLDQLGDQHGKVIVGGPGSAHSVVSAYAKQLRWMEDALKSSLDAFETHNELLARSLDVLEEDQHIPTEELKFPPRPMFESESFTFAAPSVGTPTSLKGLVADFAATDTAAQARAADQWRELSDTADRMTANLYRASKSLRDDNEGETMSAAAATIHHAGELAEDLGRNTFLLSQTLQRVGNAHRMGQETAETMLAAVEELEEPEDRKRLEEILLASFPAHFSPVVQGAVPPMNNLMSTSTPDTLPGSMIAGLDDFSKRKPVDLAELFKTGVKQLAAQKLKADAAAGGSSMSAVDAEMAAMKEVAHLVPTEAASLGAAGTTLQGAAMPPSIPASMAGGAGGAGFGGAGGLLGGLQRFGQAVSGIQGVLGGLGGVSTGLNPKTGAEGAGIKPGSLPGLGQSPSLGGSMRAGVNLPGLSTPTIEGVSGPHTGRGVGGGVPGIPGVPGVPGVAEIPKTHTAGLSAPSATSGAGLGSTPVGAGGLGLGGLNAQRGNHDLGNLRAVGANSSGGLGAGGLGAGGLGAGGLGATPGATPGSAGVGGVPPSTQGAALPRGAMGTTGAGMNSMMAGRPMMAMGAGGAGAADAHNKTKGKVKTVTSAVEEDSNTAALLGEREGVVPGVIGAWVRG